MNVAIFTDNDFSKVNGVRTALRAILDYAKRRWPLAALGGTASIGSYAIALWAMTRAPGAAVSALRETSVLFGALMGTLLLGEPFGARRVAAAAVIVIGLVLMNGPQLI